SPQAGVEMARAALEQNPACWADLWNTLGDALFGCGRVEDARRAFLRALVISPDDVRARYNRAFVHTQAREFGEALVRIAEGLGLDRTGAFRDGLLQKQGEVLQLLAQQNRQRFQGQVDRVAGGSVLRSNQGLQAMTAAAGRAEGAMQSN